MEGSSELQTINDAASISRNIAGNNREKLGVKEAINKVFVCAVVCCTVAGLLPSGGSQHHGV